MPVTGEMLIVIIKKEMEKSYRQLVKEMREKQKEYFATKNPESLKRAKELERQVDLMNDSTGLFSALESEKIKVIQERLNEASSGSWVLRREHGMIWIEMQDRPYGNYLREVLSDEDYPTKLQDATFVANAKNDITYLLNQIKKWVG